MIILLKYSTMNHNKQVARFNLSKPESKRLGVKRVLLGEGGGGGGSSNKDSQLSALRSKYQGTLTPTKGETEASTQLENIITSKELGVAAAGQQPIAQQFVTGQQKAITEAASLKSLPIQTKLANLQSRRQSAADVLKSQLGFASDDATRATALSESTADRAFKERGFQEDIRQFNVKEGRLGLDAGKETEKEKEAVLVKEGTAGIEKLFEEVKGEQDGFVSPSDYKRARSQWAKNGLPIATFDAIFGRYKNPKDKDRF